MTPYAFAKAECSNMLESDGFCWIQDEKTCKCFADYCKPYGEESICLVKRGKRCGFFEHNILPLADHPAPVGYKTIPADPTLPDRRKVARRAYLELHGLIPKEVKRPYPDCGAELSPGRRVCDSCKAKRSRAAKRKYARKVRAAVDS